MPATEVLRPLLGLLREMRLMIERLDDAGYAAPAPGRSSGGIGGHVRHCLDHMSALLASVRTGVSAYDRRARGTDIETCRHAALRRIAEVELDLSRLEPAPLDAPLRVETQLDSSGLMTVTTSSLGRELVFLTSHTIHHNAIIAHLLEARGIATGPRFGLAPSTPSDEEMACAR